MKNIVLTLTAVCMVLLLASSVLAVNLISGNAIFSASSDAPVTQKVALNDAIILQKATDDAAIPEIEVDNIPEDKTNPSENILPQDESDTTFSTNSVGATPSSGGGGSGGSRSSSERVAGEPDYSNEGGYYIPGSEKRPGQVPDQSVAFRPTKITTAKLFGFIPIPWKKAVKIQVVQGNKISETTISEDSEETIAGYDVTIGEIASEDEVEISITKSALGTPTKAVPSSIRGISGDSISENQGNSAIPKNAKPSSIGKALN